MTVDPRFYAPLGALTLGKIADLLSAEIVGDAGTEITGIASAANARRGEIAFLDGDGKSSPAISSSVGALIVAPTATAQVPDGVPYCVSKFPRQDHGRVGQALFAPRHFNWDGATLIHPNASVHASAMVGPGVVIGPEAAIGEATRIGPNTVIGPGVQIGRNCTIGSNCSLVCALVGDHVTLLSGVRLGEAGFGVTPGPNGIEDAPHFGRVILQDHVTIGANSCVDRGVFEDTILGERTRLDNLCQIGHNVVLGRSVLMAAFGGISGSVQIGDGAMLGGRVGIADHVSIGSGVSIAAGSGVLRDIPPGETWGGVPARPIKQWMREIVWLQKQTTPKKSG